MARYVNDIPTTVPIEHVMGRIDYYLATHGFVRNVDGVWQKGSGWLVSPQFLFVVPGSGFVHVEAWLRYALLPGVYLGEMGIDGFFAFIPKKMLKTEVQAIEAIAVYG